MAELLQDWVTAQAEKRSDATAVVLDEERITYGHLERRSNQLARILKEGGVQRGDRIGLLMPNIPAAVVGILGIYKADGIYVPLDPLSPAARLKKMIESTECPWILAGGPAGPLVNELFKDDRLRSSIRVGWVGPKRMEAENFKAQFCLADFDAYPSGALEYRNRREDPAHIFFTSGSTGVPKGVVVAHSSVIHFIEWAVDYFGMEASDRNSGHMGLHFDVSISDMFTNFATGAELHIVRPELNLLPNKLADFLRRAELTQWFSVPSILNYMAKFDVVRQGDFPSLKRLLWCGEVLPTPALIYWMRRLPHVRLTNLYGPTETTILSTYYTVPACPQDEMAPIPIGTPCPGEEVLVLDDKLQPLPRGQVGDLYIRGVGLSLGYWRDPEKTRAAFLPNPHSSDPTDRVYKTGDLGKLGEDGLFYFFGRKDSQIKCRGYRVELGEIEAALNALNLTQECAVVAIPADGFEGTRICCVYVDQPGKPVSPSTLRAHLGKALPSYMIPSRWMALEKLFRNANGKIDRPRLAEEFRKEEPPPSGAYDRKFG